MKAANDNNRYAIAIDKEGSYASELLVDYLKAA